MDYWQWNDKDALVMYNVARNALGCSIDVIVELMISWEYCRTVNEAVIDFKYVQGRKE